MKIEQFLKTAATAVFSEVVPGGGAILGAVNAMLPGDQQIPVTATTAQVDAAISTLPPDQRAAVLNAEIDLDKTKIKEAGETVRTMLIHDAKNVQSTRPFIARGCYWVLAVSTISICACLMFGTFSHDYATIKWFHDSWPIILALLAPFTYVLKAYFGAIQSEQAQRLNAANGHKIEQGIASLIGSLKK